MNDTVRRRLTVTGQVQGVGFRPFVYRLALEGKLSGSVKNTPEGVVIEVQGPFETVASFERDLVGKLPPLAQIVDISVEEATPEDGEEGFVIQKSSGGSGHQVLISPDTAVCSDCLRELFDPTDPRYLYPFINCTNCGPRYTITRSIPYDRPVTSMVCFPLCPRCQAEYDDPLNRRFHAQPNACPLCGPTVQLTDATGVVLVEGDEALRLLAEKLAVGAICAVKGLGGFHLACNACDEAAVARLRERKHRYGKPLAVMVPDLDTARLLGEVGQGEERWLAGRERPIVLLRKIAPPMLAPSVAPDTDFIGVVLPYTPLHHVLLAHYRESLGEAKRPAALVMTSGNLSSEPIAIGNREAIARLGALADFFLLHNRDILIRADDSVLRVMEPLPGDIPDSPPPPQFLRRARGFTPAPVFLLRKGPCVIGLGPELKNTLCVTKGGQAFVSQHIGDMENLETFGFWREIKDHLINILQVKPEACARDLHPEYMTSRWAMEQTELPVYAVQHHVAHAHAVLAENHFEGRAVALCLDGTGYGEDGTIWGGEGLLVDTEMLTHQRMAHFSPVLLPGGDTAIREPWRVAQSYLFSLGVRAPERREWPWLAKHAPVSRLVGAMLEKKLNSPATTSCGRLFDAVAGLTGVGLTAAYEGQAAMRLEQIQDHAESLAYPCPVVEDQTMILDTLSLFAAAYKDVESGAPAPLVSRRFHLGLIEGLARLGAAMARRAGVTHIGLSGGVLLNHTVSTLLPLRLIELGLTPLIHRELPPGDACISLGQASYARRRRELDGSS